MALEQCDLAIVGPGLTGMSATIAAFSRNPDQIIKVFGIPYDSNTAKKGEIELIPGIKKIVGVDYISSIVTQIFQKDVDQSQEDISNNLELIQENVTSITKGDSGFQLISESRNVTAKAIIITTGLPELKHTIKGEEEFVRKGVSHCAVCDGALFRGRKVAIIGEGNFLARGALFLRKYCKKVTILCPKATLNADKTFLKRLEKSPNVSFNYNVNLDKVEIFGSQVVEGLRFEEDGEIKEISLNAVFIELKDKPNLSIFKDITLKIDDEGFLVKDERNSTNIDGLFTAGSISGELDYVPILMGDGYKAGVFATEYLLK